MRKGRLAGVAVSLTFFLQVAPAITADIQIVSGNATSILLSELGPRFEQMTGHKLVFYKGPGTTEGVKQRIESGQPFDLAIIPLDLIDQFARQGKVVTDTRTPFVRVGMGVAVKAGAHKPDIGSVDSFKRALLDAKAICFVPGGEVAVQLANAIARFGIADAMRAKSKPQATAGQCIQLIVTGEAELFFSLTNIIASARGLELVGPFPAELQRYLVLGAGVSTTAKEADAARELIKFLMTDGAIPIIRAKGLDPAPR